MTFKNLQDDLIAELETVLKDMQTKNAAGEEKVGIKGYPHMLPVVMEDDDDVSQFIPCFIVRFEMGETEDDEDCWHVHTNVIIAICDMAKERGHESLLIAIQRIVDRFAWDPQFAHKYRVDQKIKWYVQDEDTFPFHYGEVDLIISTPKIGRKEG